MSRFPAVAFLMASVLATSVGCGALGRLCRYHHGYPGDCGGGSCGGDYCDRCGNDSDNVCSVPLDDQACCETDRGGGGDCGGGCGHCNRQHCYLLDWSCAVIRWPLAVAYKLAYCLHGDQCGCGEVYWNEFTSDPPDLCEPCDRCGRWTGPSGPYRAPYRVTPYARDNAEPTPAANDQWDPWQEDLELVSATAPLPREHARRPSRR